MTNCETAARALGWEHGGDCGGFIYHKPTWGNWKAAASWSGTNQEPDGQPAIYDTWQECCDGEGINKPERKPAMEKTLLIVGKSELVEAEYAYRAAEEFTVLEMYDGEPVAVRGFDTFEAALDSTQESWEAGCEREILFVIDR
jgi:hypothetical protein